MRILIRTCVLVDVRMYSTRVRSCSLVKYCSSTASTDAVHRCIRVWAFLDGLIIVLKSRYLHQNFSPSDQNSEDENWASLSLLLVKRAIERACVGSSRSSWRHPYPKPWSLLLLRSVAVCLRELQRLGAEARRKQGKRRGEAVWRATLETEHCWS